MREEIQLRRVGLFLAAVNNEGYTCHLLWERQRHGDKRQRHWRGERGRRVRQSGDERERGLQVKCVRIADCSELPLQTPDAIQR